MDSLLWVSVILTIISSFTLSIVSFKVLYNKYLDKNLAKLELIMIISRLVMYVSIIASGVILAVISK